MSLYPSYARPRSLAEAGTILAGLSTGTVLIAGGQELMPAVNAGTLSPETWVDIGGLPELAGISASADGIISIGALTVHRTLQTNPVIATGLPLLAYAATRAGGGRQVHNRGTIGGNIVAQHPLYDIVPSLLALRADVEVAGTSGTRRVSLAALLRETAHGLGSEAILVRVLVPAMPAGAGWAYEKLKLSGGAYGSANAAAIVTLDGGSIASLRLVIGAVADRPVDASEAAQILLGRSWGDSAASDLAAAVSALVTEPLSDAQGPADWRRAMAGVVAARAVSTAIGKAS
jgi:CO/xanthine dehydrogenase FAD-binding subunit